MLVKEHAASPFTQVLKQQLCMVMLLLKHAAIFGLQFLQLVDGMNGRMRRRASRGAEVALGPGSLGFSSATLERSLPSPLHLLAAPRHCSHRFGAAWTVRKESKANNPLVSLRKQVIFCHAFSLAPFY